MLGDISPADEIYIVCGYTDVRRSIDGLCVIVQDRLCMNPRRRALYLFCGKRCDRMKALLWEVDGFILFIRGWRTDHLIGHVTKRKQPSYPDSKSAG